MSREPMNAAEQREKAREILSRYSSAKVQGTDSLAGQEALDSLELLLREARSQAIASYKKVLGEQEQLSACCGAEITQTGFCKDCKENA